MKIFFNVRRDLLTHFQGSPPHVCVSVCVCVCVRVPCTLIVLGYCCGSGLTKRSRLRTGAWKDLANTGWHKKQNEICSKQTVASRGYKSSALWDRVEVYGQPLPSPCQRSNLWLLLFKYKAGTYSTASAPSEARCYFLLREEERFKRWFQRCNAASCATDTHLSCTLPRCSFTEDLHHLGRFSAASWINFHSPKYLIPAPTLSLLDSEPSRPRQSADNQQSETDADTVGCLGLMGSDSEHVFDKSKAEILCDLRDACRLGPITKPPLMFLASYSGGAKHRKNKKELLYISKPAVMGEQESKGLPRSALKNHRFFNKAGFISSLPSYGISFCAFSLWCVI